MGEHDGHRKRIMKKLDSGALLEHELLEVLLFNAIPRRNTNDIAHRLLSKFGSIQNIFDATFENLKQVEGVGESVAAYLFCIGRFYKAYYSSEEKECHPEFFEVEEFISYVKEAYKKFQKEVLDVYFLDENGKILTKRRFGETNYFNAELSPEELTLYFSECKPSGMVLVHNHPFGEATPSNLDDEMTAECQLICSAQNVLFCDHIIYAPNGVYSYYLSGKMREITQAYSMKKMVKEMKEKNAEQAWHE